jgi:hypothetical protein
MKSQSTLAVLLVLGTFVSCNIETQKSSSSSSSSHHISVGNITSDTTLTPKEKAEKLALAGEQLVTLTGFMYAGDILDTALTLDPLNKRAQFYKSLIGAPLKLKGILTRVKPLIKDNPEAQKSYDEVVANIPNGGLKNFLFNGSENIRTEKDVQAFLDEIYSAQDKFRTFLKNNRTTELTLNLNDVGLLKQSMKETLESCYIEQVGSGSYDIKNCDLSKVMQLELNRADLESLQHITAGTQLYIMMYNSYDISGSVKVMRELQNSNSNTTSQEVWEKLASNTAFGKVRNPRFLQSIPNLGMDVVSGIRWAISMQSELCPSGQNEQGQRKGHLFSKGVCISSENDGEPVENILKVIDVVLAGQTQMVKFGDMEAEVKPTAILNKPVQDLKALKPQFNECGKISSISDASVGGLFPNRDANKILENGSKCDPQSEETEENEE